MTGRRIIAALLAAALIGGAGALLLDRVVDGDRTGVEADGGSPGASPGSTSSTAPGPGSPAETAARAAARAFPDDIPRDGDGECSVPRTDPDRPAIESTGEPTDGVEVSAVTVADRAEGEIVVTATVSDRPVVQASSGSKWVLIELGGVRRFDAAEATVESDRVRSEPANLCDDSAVAVAYAFDARVTGLELVRHDDATVEVLVRLAE